MSAYKFTPQAVASPDAPQKPLVRKRVRSGGAKWVQVGRCISASPEKRPRTPSSQQPACTHKEHQILTTAEAASFASQSWDCKVHPTKASQHEFLATYIDVDLEKNVQRAQWHKYTRKRGHQTTYFVPYHIVPYRTSILCIVQFAAPVAQKCDHLAPPTHSFLKMAFSHRFQKVYTYPPQRDEILVHWTKSS